MNYFHRKLEWLAQKLYAMLIPSKRRYGDEPTSQNSEHRNWLRKTKVAGPAGVDRSGIFLHPSFVGFSFFSLRAPSQFKRAIVVAATIHNDAARIREQPHRCRAQIKIEDTDIVPRTKKMLKESARLFLIFSLLCGIESPTLPPQATSQSPSPGRNLKLFLFGRSKSESYMGSTSNAAQPAQSEHAANKKSKHRKSRLLQGTGYGGSELDNIFKKATPSQTIKSDENTEDLELYFRALSCVLPSRANKSKRLSPFELQPQPLVAAMIRRSPMLHRACEALRHAAIEEISARHSLISAVLEFIDTTADHYDTSAVLLNRRPLFPRDAQLLHAVLGVDDHKTAPAVTEYETAQSLSSILEQLSVPCRKFIETYRRLGTSDARDGKKVQIVAQKICLMADQMEDLTAQMGVQKIEEHVQPPPSPPPNTSNVTTRRMRAKAAQAATNTALQEIAKKASAWHRENCVKEVPDEMILEGFHFSHAASAAETANVAKGRMMKLIAQVSSLSTDLPEGIFVRHGESRPDVLKFLIVGPVGTPYEHGLFEFDMFCGKDFPQAPPRVFFRTTAGGTVRFNPNLYTNGKVCLSLLGTWSGTPWDPKTSTILQVLVSIQSMIFNDQPYYNEPGYEYKPNDARSEAYNRDIEHNTVKVAMHDWLVYRLACPKAAYEPRASGSGSSPPPPTKQSTKSTGAGQSSTGSAVVLGKASDSGHAASVPGVTKSAQQEVGANSSQNLTSYPMTSQPYPPTGSGYGTASLALEGSQATGSWSTAPIAIPKKSAPKLADTGSNETVNPDQPTLGCPLNQDFVGPFLGTKEDSYYDFIDEAVQEIDALLSHSPSQKPASTASHGLLNDALDSFLTNINSDQPNWTQQDLAPQYHWQTSEYNLPSLDPPADAFSGYYPPTSHPTIPTPPQGHPQPNLDYYDWLTTDVAYPYSSWASISTTTTPHTQQPIPSAPPWTAGLSMPTLDPQDIPNLPAPSTLPKPSYTPTPAMKEALNKLKASAGHYKHAHKRQKKQGLTPKPPPTEDDPIWGEVVRHHFELKGQMIVDTVKGWEKLGKAGWTRGKMKTAAEGLRREMARYGFAREGEGEA
ncbi:hypothetical protein VTI74DRAFT_9922 [Chaetomium olivicolor]